MELVYLWVEKYKNIEKQGFHFSPRFECKFYDEYETYTDENGEIQERLKDNCKLVICDKKKNETLDKDTKACKPCKENDFIENFFGDNINVTAIVGKNGSGKSSVLKILTKIFNSKSIIKDFSYYCIYTINNILYLRDDQKILAINEITKNNLEEINFNSDILISIFYNCITNFLVSSGYTNLEYDRNDHLFNGLKPELENIHKAEEEFFYQKYARLPLGFFKKINFNYHFNKFFIFYQDNSLSHIVNLLDNQNNLNQNIQYKIISDIIKNEMTSYYDMTSYTELAKSIEKKEVKEEVLKKIIDREIKNLEDMEKFIIDVKSFFEKNQLTIKNAEEKNKVLNFLLENTTINEIQKSFTDFSYDEINDKFQLKTKNLIEIDSYLADKILLDYLVNQNIFKIELYDKEKPNILYSMLSSGEKYLIKHLTNIIFSIYNLNKPQNYLILSDEIELSLHPSWQKNLIFYIQNSIQEIQKLKKTKLKIQIILTTHSPFLLSDIPKQNIIFLDTDEEGKCKVVDGLNDKKQTFGANIHTLLSDSFFMEDGLMGEFAKGKIDEAFDLLTKTTITKEEQKYCEEIISIIGEPIIKRQLQKMLDSKRLSKIDKIDELQQQIEALQQQVKELHTDA